jgi:nucleoid-associated protein YgaU
MGLFGFVKDLGKKLFSSEAEAEAAEKIEASIGADNPGVDGLGVSFENGVVSLSGKAATAEALEKAVLMAGNIQGVTEVNVDGLDAPEPAPEVEYYTIVSGDSLSKIAKQFYGNAMDYPKLFEANKEVIKDPDLIYPGQKIRVPPKTW